MDKARPRPARIEPGHFVTDVLEWFPPTAGVFEQHRFTMLNQPMLRRTLARGVTLGQAARLRGGDEARFLRDLNDAAGLAPPPPAPRVELTVSVRRPGPSTSH